MPPLPRPILNPETGEIIYKDIIRPTPIKAAERPEPLEPATELANRPSEERSLPGTPWINPNLPVLED